MKSTTSRFGLAAIAVLACVAGLGAAPASADRATTASHPAGAHPVNREAPADPAAFAHVIENRTFTSTLVVQQSDTLVRNNTVHDVDGTCIYIRGAVHNVRIEGNKISTCRNGGKGVFVTTVSDTHDISIVGNTITNTWQDGIHAGNHSFNLYVAGNDVSNTGDDPLYHGMYIKAQDALIEDNRVHDIATKGGDGGIGLRSSGIVRRNIVWNTGGYGIRYVSTQPKGASDKVIIENNVVYSTAKERTESLIQVLPSGGHDFDPVDNFYIRFNTIVAMSGDRVLLTNSLPSSKTVEAYGNLLVNVTGSSYTSGAFDLDKANVKSRSTKGFSRVSGSHPYDLGLVSGSPAIDAAAGVPYVPATDRAGRTRTGTPDAGGYTYNG